MGQYFFYKTFQLVETPTVELVEVLVAELVEAPAVVLVDVPVAEPVEATGHNFPWQLIDK